MYENPRVIRVKSRICIYNNGYCTERPTAHITLSITKNTI